MTFEVTKTTLFFALVKNQTFSVGELGRGLGGRHDLDGLERSWLNQASFGLLDPPKAPQFDYRPGFES